MDSRLHPDSLLIGTGLPRRSGGHRAWDARLQDSCTNAESKKGHPLDRSQPASVGQTDADSAISSVRSVFKTDAGNDASLFAGGQRKRIQQVTNFLQVVQHIEVTT